MLLYLGNGMAVRGLGLDSVHQRRRLHASFGILQEICCVVSRMLDRGSKREAKQDHLPWDILFLKSYATEKVLCVFEDCD